MFFSAVHPRRVAALKALSFAPTTSSDRLATVYEIVFGILDKVCISSSRPSHMLLVVQQYTVKGGSFRVCSSASVSSLKIS